MLTRTIEWTTAIHGRAGRRAIPILWICPRRGESGHPVEYDIPGRYANQAVGKYACHCPQSFRICETLSRKSNRLMSRQLWRDFYDKSLTARQAFGLAIRRCSGQRGGDVSSVREAVSRLGCGAIRDLAFSLQSSDVLRTWKTTSSQEKVLAPSHWERRCARQGLGPRTRSKGRERILNLAGLIPRCWDPGNGGPVSRKNLATCLKNR